MSEIWIRELQEARRFVKNEPQLLVRLNGADREYSDVERVNDVTSTNAT